MGGLRSFRRGRRAHVCDRPAASLASNAPRAVLGVVAAAALRWHRQALAWVQPAPGLLWPFPCGATPYAEKPSSRLDVRFRRKAPARQRCANLDRSRVVATAVDDGDATSSAATAPARLPCPIEGMTQLTEADIRCVEERHLFHRQRGIKANFTQKILGAGRRCRHGWPQALMYDPIWASGKLGDITRLTCPLLVEAIDKYEREGAILRYNERLEEDAVWKQQALETNVAHRDLRRSLVQGRDEEMADVQKLMGEEIVDIIMTTGLSMMKLDQSDVKCLHAQVGDQLVRGNNSIGRQVLEDLEARGVDTMGTDCCCDHCDFNMPLGEGRWEFKSAKNHLGKRMRKLRVAQQKLQNERQSSAQRERCSEAQV